MKTFTAVKIAGLILLSIVEISATIILWKLLSPHVPPATEPISQYWFPVSMFWWWATITSILFLLGLSVILSTNRLRQLMILSLCFGLIIVVAWLRSYGDCYYCYLHKITTGYANHSLWQSNMLRTGDGGIGFTYQERDDWDWEDQGDPMFRNAGYHLYVANDPPRPGQSYYPGWPDDSAIWKGGWLDKLGIRLWYSKGGIEGIRTPDYLLLWSFTLPYWVLEIPCCVAPAFYLRRVFRHWRRNRHGLCFKCGYDLRAQPSGGKCPECGTSVPPRKNAALAGASPIAGQVPPLR